MTQTLHPDILLTGSSFRHFKLVVLAQHPLFYGFLRHLSSGLTATSFHTCALEAHRVSLNQRKVFN